MDNYVEDITFAPRVFNSFDEAALETARRLAEELRGAGKDVYLEALTLLSPEEDIEHFAQNLHAVGFDRVTALTCTDDLRFLPMDTARYLAKYLSENGPWDLVFTGCQAVVGDSRLVPPQIAERLELHYIPDLTKIVEEDGLFVAESQTDQGILRQTIEGPTLCAVGNAQYNYLRIATLREKLKFRSKQMVTTPITPLEKGEDLQLLALQPAYQEKACDFLTANTAQELAELLYEREVAAL